MSSLSSARLQIHKTEKGHPFGQAVSLTMADTDFGCVAFDLGPCEWHSRRTGGPVPRARRRPAATDDEAGRFCCAQVHLCWKRGTTGRTGNVRSACDRRPGRSAWGLHGGKSACGCRQVFRLVRASRDSQAGVVWAGGKRGAALDGGWGRLGCAAERGVPTQSERRLGRSLPRPVASVFFPQAAECCGESPVGIPGHPGFRAGTRVDRPSSRGG